MSPSTLTSKDDETPSAASDSGSTFAGGFFEEDALALARFFAAVVLKQKGQGLKIELIDAKSPTAHHVYVKQRAKEAYIASVCQYEASFD